MEIQKHTPTELVLADLNNNIQTLAKVALINLPENTSLAKAQQIVLRELINFEMILLEKPEYANLDKTSIMLAVKQSIVDNLTLNPHAKLVYLIPGKVCIGMNGSTKIYKDILTYSPTSEGHLSIARQAGSILDHERPEVTYDATGMVVGVSFKFKARSGAWKIVSFDTNDFERWKQKSAAKFNGNANANYTSYKGGIDPEFARAKAIKHGLKKLGTNANEVQHHASENLVNIEHTELVDKKVEVENLKTLSTSLTERIEIIKEENHIQDVKFEEVPVAETKTPVKSLELPDNNDLF